MPTYEGQIEEQELFSLVEYIRALNTPTDATQPQDSNPANETGLDNTPGSGPEAGEPDEQPADTGAAAMDPALSGDQPDAADNDPTGAEADEDN
jgi:hypothetical protein